ncbi:hypothetical protein FHETE_11273 [Fusarium heterosporum]|uniref:HNH nuclease domain-containing protein n=1 Tax=Fusarium heterosporum TaxID=42747 RepID=A0A8H5SPJ8_FUSHE|nr:hypothetical protein FHETE_11273 [Fusarium heterosporum]
MLNTTPVYYSPQTSLTRDEAEIRLGYASKIQEKIRSLLMYRTFQLNAVHVSAILVVPLFALQPNGYLDSLEDNQTPPLLILRLNAVASLVKHYLQNSIQDDSESQSDDGDDKPEAPGHTKAAGESDQTYQHKKKNRNRSEREACRDRDGHKCVFMSTPVGEVAHILPFVWNSTASDMEITSCVIEGCRAFFKPGTGTEIINLLCNPSELGSTVKRWNMIYMNAQLHDWWSNAFIGLKCLGITPVDGDQNDPKERSKVKVFIQYHNLFRRWSRPHMPMILEGENSDFMKLAQGLKDHEKAGHPRLTYPKAGKLEGVEVNTHTPIITGHVVEVSMPAEEAVFFHYMLDLAWYLSRIAAMSGGAEYVDYLPDHEDWDEIKQRAAVTDWIDGIGP